MGKKNKSKNQQPIPKTEKAPEALIWGDLLLARRDAADAIMTQQLLIVELNKLYETVINNDSELFSTIEGLLKTLEDLAKDTNSISLSHAVTTDILQTKDGEVTIATSFKEGVVAEGEDQMSYIQIGALYLSVVDKVAHLAGSAYLDVFARLKTDTSELTKVINDGTKETEKIKGAQNESGK